MTDPNTTEVAPAELPEAVVHTGSHFSIIWLVPLVAAAIGLWLIYTALSEKGPTITITFKSAEGIEADKTKIKYKEVQVGLVDSITLSKDLSNVIVKANLVKGAEIYLKDKTRFWVVRPRISASEISGLGTLFGGAYIAVDPSQKGKDAFSFTGLEHPPVVTTDLPGSSFVLQAERLGSLDTGSPIYYRQLRVGEVESYGIGKDGKVLDIKIFINSPYDRFVFKNTRFWNAGGVNFAIDANGVKVDMESFVTLMLGGIAFDTPVGLETSEPAKDGDIFKLYDNHEETLKKSYTLKSYWIVNFNGSVRGLSPEAPVEFRGIQVGRVLDINLKVDPDNLDFSIPVLIEIEPERIFNIGMVPDEKASNQFMTELVKKGMRAQLKPGNLLTGKLFVDLDFHPDAPPRQIIWKGKYPELPTIQAPLEEIFASLSKSLNRINKLPIEDIGNDVRTAVKNLNEILTLSKSTLDTVNKGVGPQATATLEQAKKTLASMENAIGTNSPLNQDARQAMEEMADAARSIRALVDYLERHPDSLIYGKENP